MKIYTQTTYPNLRAQFTTTIYEVFGDIDKFLDMIDGRTGSGRFDIATTERPDGEYYIIDRRTGKYIDWYKYTHLGRDIHMNFSPDKMKDFLIEFKTSMEDDSL